MTPLDPKAKELLEKMLDLQTQLWDCTRELKAHLRGVDKTQFDSPGEAVVTVGDLLGLSRKAWSPDQAEDWTPDR